MNRNIAVLIMLGALFLATGIFLYPKQNPVRVQPPKKLNSDITQWELYSDAEYGFQISYPQEWSQSIHGANLVLSMTDASNSAGPTVSISPLENYPGQKVEDIFNGISETKIDFKNNCRKIDFAGSPGFDCPSIPNFCQDATFFYHMDLPFLICDDILSGVSRAIISSFRFTK